tara:strand:- start:120 stop:422 length:303 start_codon:yes stop_codon:yes gene_type:complete
MDIEKYVKAYRSGESLDSLAENSGVSRTTLTKRIREHTAIRKSGHSRPGPRKLGPEWDDIGRVPDEGLAKRLGCSRQNVAKVRKARGIPSHRETARKCQS